MKDYEINHEKKYINYHFLAVIGVCALIIVIMFYPMVKSMFKPAPIPVVENKTNISTVIQIEYVTVLVTPTIDGKQYFASEYQTGMRKIGRPFSYYRKDALGKQDMAVTINVYDYRIFEKYHWFNPQDYKYYEALPSNPNSKFLFVFINVYQDDVIGDDTRLWGYDEKHFGVQIGNKLYMPISFEKQLRIKELENAVRKDEKEYIEYYGSDRYYTRNLDHKSTAGETYENLTYVRGGASNNIDGYLVYEIPASTREEDIMVNGAFNAFGDAQWLLKPISN